MPIGKKKTTAHTKPAVKSSSKVDEVHSMILNSIRLSQRMKPGYITLLVVAVFVGILWYAYPRGADQYANVEVPIIRAEDRAYREKPVEEGGMEIPHQESTVFEPLEVVEATVVEKLLPEPEEPVSRESLPQKSAIPKEPELNLDKVIEKVLEPEVVVASDIVPVQKPAVVPTAPKVTQPKVVTKPVVTSGTRYIQLGAFRSDAAATKQWQKIKNEFGVLVTHLTKRVVTVDLGDKGIFYRLQAGKVTAAKAKKICASINVKYKGSCILARK